MDRITYFRKILDQRGIGKTVTEEQVLEVIGEISLRPRLGIPDYADDSDNDMGELLSLNPNERKILGLPSLGRPVRPLPEVGIIPPGEPMREVRSMLRVTKNVMGPEFLGSLVGVLSSLYTRSFKFEPILRIRVHAAVCRNNNGLLSDGDKGQSKQELGETIAKAITYANKIYESASIELVFYPSADIEMINDTKLNQCFILNQSDRKKLRQDPPLEQKELEKLCEAGSMSSYRDQFARKYPGKLVLLFAEGTRLLWGSPGERNWRWCKKCQHLFFAKNNLGVCPLGGQHDMSGSGNYVLNAHEPDVPSQYNWRLCKKCQGLFFAGHNLGVCSAGGQHEISVDTDYGLVNNVPDVTGQDNWRWCKKCQGLFFGGHNLGVCPAGGQHDMSGSGNYRLGNNEPEERWFVSSPRGGGFSSDTLEFVKLRAGIPSSEAEVEKFSTFMSHETGHYFHLCHTFVPIGLTNEEKIEFEGNIDKKITILKNRILGILETEYAKPTPANQVTQALDGDKSTVDDTPPDDSGQLLYYMNRAAGNTNACGPIGTVSLNLDDGTPVSYTPDRSLVMSYFFGCLNFNQGFSEKQAGRMRNAIINGNRRHLAAVQLGETAWPNDRVCAAWNPNTASQFYCWDYRNEDFLKKYKEHHDNGMRLRSQQAYTRNGETHYDGIWNPGTQEEIVVWGWKIDDFKAKNIELFGQGMRLVHMESYLLPDGQVQVNAIWNPGTHNQRWIQGWSSQDFAHFDFELQSKGFRLAHINGWNLPDGQVRYDAIWNPGSHKQFQMLGATVEQFKQKYGQMWEKDFKLLLFDSHLAGKQILFDAVWHPNPGPQFVVWNMTREQVGAYYDEMWQQGMKLISMSAVLLK